MMAIISILLEKLPWVARLPFYFALFLVWLLFKGFEYGAKAPAEAEAWFDRNFERNYGPTRKLREEQLKRIDEKLQDIGQDTRDIRNHLLGRSK